MSRLDAEYDPAEHHDLDRIEPYPITGKTTGYVAVCACGAVCRTRRRVDDQANARAAHDEHRDYELGLA